MQETRPTVVFSGKLIAEKPRAKIRKGQGREEDLVTVVALQGVQISLQEIFRCACPKAAGSEGRR